MNEKETENIIRNAALSIKPREKWLEKQVNFLNRSLENETFSLSNRNALYETKKQPFSFFTLIFKFFSMQVKNIAFYTILGIVGIFALCAVSIFASDDAKPGDLLYGIDRAVESVQVSLTGLRGEKAQAEMYLSLADERIAELEALTGKTSTLSLIPVVYAQENTDELNLTDKEKTDIDNLVNDYNEDIDKANELAKEAKANGVDTDELLTKISEKTLKHQEVLLGVYDKVPDQAKDAIMNAMEKSQNGHDTAISAISGEKKLEIQQKQEEKKQELELKIEERKNRGQKDIDTDDVEDEDGIENDENDNDSNDRDSEDEAPVSFERPDED